MASPAPHTERDPAGLDAHTPGAKLDAGKPRPLLVLRDFARALNAVIEVAEHGARKYTDGGWLRVDNGIERYSNALYRHLLDEAIGSPWDGKSGLPHAAHVAWNALARLELALREQRAASMYSHPAAHAAPIAEHVCPECLGSGSDGGTPDNDIYFCMSCLGTGKQTFRQCPACEGSGVANTTLSGLHGFRVEFCATCNGKGELRCTS